MYPSMTMATKKSVLAQQKTHKKAQDHLLIYIDEKLLTRIFNKSGERYQREIQTHNLKINRQRH